MSKIIEALQERIQPTKKSKQPKSSESGKAYEMTQQELADVYFAGSGKKPEKLPAPTIVRVIDKKNRTFFFPWLITTLALLLLTFALFSSKRIWIDVQIIDESVWDTARAPSPRQPPIPHQAVPLTATSPEDVQLLSPLNFRFAGAAVLNSSRERHMLTLMNSSLSGIAYAAMDFKPSVNALQRKLVFEARGKNGGEQLELIFKDADNNSSLNQKRIQPFPTGLSTHWQMAEITIQEGPAFHANRITQMRFEFGSQRTENESSSALFLKNIQWLPITPET